MVITTRGTWPGQLTLRRGWAKAVARPWNDDCRVVQVRLVRGSKEFVADCATKLAPQYGRVVSPPLPEPGMKIWKEAGFTPWLYLDLYSRDLNNRISRPEHAVVDGTSAAWESAISIDQAAFKPTWRLGAAGLNESRQATGRSAFLVIWTNHRVVGFAIVGVSGTVSYLQRVAVDPDYQGKGFGRSLVRASLTWGNKHGASSMILNTQPDNDPAAELYKSEGFSRLPAGLHVLQFEPS